MSRVVEISVESTNSIVVQRGIRWKNKSGSYINFQKLQTSIWLKGMYSYNEECFK
jgi:hypothetical protein